MWVAVVGSGFGTVSDAGEFFISQLPALVPSSLAFARLNPAPRLFAQVNTLTFSSANAPVSTLYRAPATIVCRALTRQCRCGSLPASSCAASPLQPVAPRTLQWLSEVQRCPCFVALFTQPLLADAVHTLENAIAYESPQVTSVAPKNSPMYGGFFVTLLGRHFGHIDTTVRFLRCASTPVPPRGPASCSYAQLQHQGRRLIVLAEHVVQRQQHPVQGALPPSGCPPTHSLVIVLQLRPGEGSSKMIEVDALYSPHLQQQPQVRLHPRPPQMSRVSSAQLALRLALIMRASFWIHRRSHCRFKSFSFRCRDFDHRRPHIVKSARITKKNPIGPLLIVSNLSTTTHQCAAKMAKFTQVQAECTSPKRTPSDVALRAST